MGPGMTPGHEMRVVAQTEPQIHSKLLAVFAQYGIYHKTEMFGEEEHDYSLYEDCKDTLPKILINRTPCNVIKFIVNNILSVNVMMNLTGQSLTDVLTNSTIQ